MKIISPLASGNGAHVLHKSLERHISGFRVVSYSPWLTLFPPAIGLVGHGKKADLIHTTPDYAIWSARQKLPLVVTFHNYVLDPFMDPYSSFLQRVHYHTDLRWFTRLAVKRATVLTAVSRFTADLARRDLGIGQEIQVIHNGIDETRFIPPSTRPRNRSLQVLFSGNQTSRKGIHWLSSIAERLDGGIEVLYTQGLRTKMRLPSHPHLRCVGNVPYEAMPDYYRKVDVLLLPTVREGLPLAALEAMACGLPVVATDCSSLSELIDDAKGGFLCPLGDVDAFAKKINLLADSPGLRREMGQYNRTKVEEMFTLRRMVAEYRALFKGVLN